jgi:hypothetical protein
MYIVFIIDHIHHLMNEYKTQSLVYNSNRIVYFLEVEILLFSMQIMSFLLTFSFLTSVPGY